MPPIHKGLAAASVLGAGLLAAPSIGLSLDMPSVSVGAGMRTSFVNTDYSGTATDSADFSLNSARIYLSGKVTDNLSFMFNTEYNGSSVDVIDAAAQFSFSDQFNIWAGRFLPPSDRANLYGPYYASNWGVYQDGIQDGYQFTTTGRDDGIAYWGQFGIAKVSLGAFDVPITTGTKDILYAGRVQFDLWDPEGGYYLNGTYYGGKNLLAIGGAVQAQDGNTASSVDLLFEKKLGDSGTVTIESEYAKYDKLGGYDAKYASSDGAYVLGSYLFPKPAGIGKFEVLGKFAKANFSKGASSVFKDYDQKTSEFNLNYIIKEFNARVMFFVTNTTFSAMKTNFMQAGVGLQIQM